MYLVFSAFTYRPMRLLATNCACRVHFLFWHYSPTQAQAASCLRYLEHTQFDTHSRLVCYEQVIGPLQRLPPAQHNTHKIRISALCRDCHLHNTTHTRYEYRPFAETATCTTQHTQDTNIGPLQRMPPAQHNTHKIRISMTSAGFGPEIPAAADRRLRPRPPAPLRPSKLTL
jgi:hypothetical protein